jgi:hypothetical protein
MWWWAARGGGSGGSAPAALLAAAAAYQLASRVSSEAVCRAMPVLRAAMVDAAGRGAGQHLRYKPAALIGAAEFLPRVAASLAPVVGFAITGGSGGGGAASGAAVWAALLAVPAATAAAQHLILRGMGTVDSTAALVF